MTRKQKIALMTLFLAATLTESIAQDLGAQGSLYEIKEQDALQWIGKKLQEMQSSGEISRQQSILKEKALLTVERPAPVKGLKPTERPRTFEKDLTVFVASDIKDAKGNLI